MYQVSLLQYNWLAMKMANAGFMKHIDRLKGVVYDLGCGTRPFEAEIRARADKYVGVDWEHSYHGRHADILADLNETLPIDDASADAVIALSVLEHLREPEQMLRESFRILRPGGFIYIGVPFQWEVHEAPHDYYRFTRHGLEYLLGKTGFVAIDVEENSGFWTTWILKLNYQTGRLLRGPAPLRLLIHACLLPLWLLDQGVAPVLDRMFPAPSETQGYNAIAIKP
jgi:SAM-dependent methyltransferase